MSDVSHEVGGDFTLDSGGNLVTVSGSSEGMQRILRRLCTNPDDYVWNSSYGAGLPAMIGDVGDVQNIQAIVSSQMALECDVDLSSSISVNVSEDEKGGFYCQIQYVSVADGGAQSVAVAV